MVSVQKHLGARCGLCPVGPIVQPTSVHVAMPRLQDETAVVVVFLSTRMMNRIWNRCLQSIILQRVPVPTHPACIDCLQRHFTIFRDRSNYPCRTSTVSGLKLISAASRAHLRSSDRSAAQVRSLLMLPDLRRQ